LKVLDVLIALHKENINVNMDIGYHHHSEDNLESKGQMDTKVIFWHSNMNGLG
jgi:hypothetical protein